METYDIIFLIAGVLAGALAAYLYLKNKYAAATIALQQKTDWLEKTLTEQKEEHRQQAEKYESIIRDERQRVEMLHAELSALRTERENLNQRLAEQKNELQQTHEKLTKEFENLANRILDEKAQKFTQQNQTNLESILTPLKERIREFEQKVEQTYKAESAERIHLKAEIKHLIEQSARISQEANNLATALKGDNKQQGNWGELVLERILERSGLQKGEEYITQVTTTNPEGKTIKPDVVVLLPDDKHLFIDSKVSLVAYEQYINATEPQEKAMHLRRHVESVRNHIKLLSDKSYQHAAGYAAPDFVLMFIPIESSFSLALQADADLFQYAWERRVVIVSPTTLLATLRTVASIWKNERQSRNVQLIAEEGGKLYDKFVAFTEDLIKLGHSMNKARDEYQEAMQKLTTGKGNLVRRAEKMRELGAKTSKNLNQKLIERMHDEDEA
ncbi:MAG: DNA recombination protein RmuC [Chitinophagales bacterium]|nr:DNA recombination protein RmuC [Chitinophagales bacterium]MDW8418039.1 DNA recombination protein RmuC [Chitinophagales bacterium]